MINTSKLKLTYKRKGFTIVELIVVMAILAILTLIAMPIFKNYIEKAEDTKEVANVNTAFEAAFAAVTQEYTNPTSTYKTPGYDTSNNGLSKVKPKPPELYYNILEYANITDDNVEVYTIKKGNKLNDFTYENTYPNADKNKQFVDEWSILIPIDSDKNANVDISGNIYVIPPAFRPERYVYKNGSKIWNPNNKADDEYDDYYRLWEYVVGAEYDK